jgi:uncharacterized heparinase superfamily protein
MLQWLNHISYQNGEIPLLNDSANKIAPTTEQLNEYAKRLQINQSLITNYQLQSSGYRKIKRENYECIVDVGEVGASYIPGHAHADTFNFELYIKNKPFVVDTGLSTYNIGKQRDFERSTKAHNTVEINETSSSEVWGGFRVGNRANIVNVVRNIDHIKATHDGYMKKFGMLHTRTWVFEENKIIISDSLSKECNAIARLHFHPDISEEEIVNKLIIENGELKIKEYGYSSEFNKSTKSLVAEILFEKELKVEINI